MSAREIRGHYEKGGILVGELVPYLMGWNYKHENLYPLLSLIRDLNMVVSIHPSRDFTPVARIMDNVPGLKLVVAHLGGYELYDQILQLMKTHETVYTDLSAHGTPAMGQSPLSISFWRHPSRRRPRKTSCTAMPRRCLANYNRLKTHRISIEIRCALYACASLILGISQLIMLHGRWYTWH